MTDIQKVIRLGARGSLLSRMQSQTVAKMVEAVASGARVELVVITTTGDRIQDKALHEFGGKGLFTKELEQALLKNEVDFAVHSFKDVPVTMPLVDTSDLVIAATPTREDPRDCFVSLKAKKLADLPQGAKVGTGSLRRQAQVLALRPDLKLEPIRGNVDTRLRKLRDGEFDAVILAMAGLKRSGLFDPSLMSPMNELLPAAGQGALAIECRRDDLVLRDILGKLNDPDSALAVRVERAVVLGLNGDCHSPIAAHAIVQSGRVKLNAIVARRGGLPPLVRAHAEADVGEGLRAAEDVVKQLVALGAREMLGT